MGIKDLTSYVRSFQTSFLASILMKKSWIYFAFFIFMKETTGDKL
jgi:hypothetical protein